MASREEEDDELIKEFNALKVSSPPISVPVESDWLYSCSQLASIRDIDRTVSERRPSAHVNLGRYPVVDFTKIDHGELPADSLTALFISRLKHQKHLIAKEQLVALTAAEQLLQQAKSDILRSKSLPTELEEIDENDDFDQQSQKWKVYFSALKSIEDINIKRKGFKPPSDHSSSLPFWSLKTFSQFISKDRCEVRNFEPLAISLEEDLPTELVERIINHVVELGGCIQGWETQIDDEEKDADDEKEMTSLDNLQRVQLLEAVSRVFIDAVVLPLCLLHSVTTSMEETLSSNDLANSKFDYLLFKDLSFLGVVEAKRVGASLTKAFVQTSLQLFLIHSKMPNIQLPLSGIITNGFIYVFVLLTRKTLFVSKPFGTSTKDELKTVISVIHNIFRKKFPENVLEDDINVNARRKKMFD